MVKGHITDRHESLRHFILKAMLYYKLKCLEHIVEMEYRINDCTIDVLDVDSKIAYEIQENMHRDILKDKFEKYLKNIDIIDIIPIPISRFKGWNLKEWDRLLEKFIPYKK